MLVSAIATVVTQSPLPILSLSNSKSHSLFSNSLFFLSKTRNRNLVSNPSCFLQTLNPNPNSDPDDAIRHVTHSDSDDSHNNNHANVASAAALASAIRKASTSPVEFTQRVEKDQRTGLVLPSPDFQRLCLQQLHLFRRIVPEALLSVYVRPAGSYVMDRLELRRVAVYPGDAESVTEGIVILVGDFNIPAGLRAAEAALSNLQVKVVPECKAVVLPMVKHPFVVGFLVAELPLLEVETSEKPPSDGLDNRMSVEEHYSLPPFLDLDKKSWEIQTLRVNDEPVGMFNFTSEQRLNAINISQSLAMAYVMDQKAMLLQQSTWQNNVRMSNLVEQIRGPLSSIQTLSKILSMQTKRSQISYDIVEDILVQGDRLRDVLQQLQDAVYLTKANIVRYNEEAIKKMNGSTHILAESVRSLDSSPRDGSANKMKKSSESLSLSAATHDVEMPLPPLALAPLQQGIRPCNVSEVLADLVDSVRPLAQSQKRVVELSELSSPLQAAVEEPALRQAFSNLIEGALLRTQVRGKVEIVSTAAPAGGALVIIDDDGPDMHYMTQMHSLTPYGQELLSDESVEDNMTWNFVAGLTVAREILESYGCVVRVISPRTKDAPLGTGGTRVELWLPSAIVKSDLSSHAQEV
ncbi:chloroplast sensor kinase, chloroplastic [Gastrolobium bilobum]|uniref:chloroplast sensor kinase, chloroplastic n=1 Tax=Gastrolobium bilobum TaxID=150636 RepID=UPI002AB0A0EA|nr:chloroplast sensor kinase, chloroplastic [Gastrolobium bilobum]